MTEQIRIALVKCGNLSEAELARRMGISPQNLSNKMRRDNFSQSELKAVAEALNLQYESFFIMRDTGERI